MKIELPDEHVDEILANLLSIDKILNDENRPSRHGDILPEIYTIHDFIKQIKKHGY